MPITDTTKRKITLIILSWKRSRNVSRIVATYIPFYRIDEIILWNNDPRCEFKIHHRKIKYFKSENYFTISRYAATFFARNDDIMFHDDDLLLREDQIEKLFEAHLTYPDSIVGCFGRNFKKGTYVKKYSFGKVDVVLGRVILFKRSLISNFVKNCPPFHGALKDDILFCLSQDKKPIAINVGDIEELPKRYALSKRTYHLARRQEMVEFCLGRRKNQ